MYNYNAEKHGTLSTIMHKLQMRAKGKIVDVTQFIRTIMYKLQCGQKVKNCNCGELTQNADFYTDALHNVKKFKAHGPPDGKSEKPIEKIDTRMSST